MPKYSITRKINLGRLGLQYEAIDIGVSDCLTKKEAMDEIRVWKAKIIEEVKEEIEQLKNPKPIGNKEIPF